LATTGKQARLDVGRKLNHEDKDTLLEVVNTTGTATASLTDATRLASTRFTSQSFQDRWVRHSDDSATPSGSLVFARVLTPSTGLLTVSPDFEAALATDDDLELWKINPDDVDRGRDRALQNLCTRWRLSPLSLLNDPDFRTDAVGSAPSTHWTAANANTTVAVETGTERFSERVMRVVSTSGGGGAYQDINVRGSEGWYLAAVVQANVGTAIFEVQDLTNGSVAITLNDAPRDSWDGEAFQRIGVTFTTPATCEQIRVFLKTTATSDDTFWANINCYPTAQTDFVLPSRVLNSTYAGEFFEMAGEDVNEEHLHSRWFQPRMIDAGGGNVRAILPTGVGSRPVFYQEFSNYAPYQTGYSTPTLRRAGDVLSQDIPLEYATYATLFEMYGDKYLADWKRVHAKHGAKPYVRFQSPQYVSA
jgi:hypothetical protein